MRKSRLLDGFKKWQRLDAADRGVPIEAFARLFWVRACLRILPFRTVVHRFRMTETPRNTRTSLDPGRRRLIARVVAAVANYVPPATCLTRSIALVQMLRSRGDAVVLKIGVAKSKSGGLDAHAWVELVDGTLLDGNAATGYTPILALQSPEPLIHQK